LNYIFKILYNNIIEIFGIVLYYVIYYIYILHYILLCRMLYVLDYFV